MGCKPRDPSSVVGLPQVPNAPKKGGVATV